MNFFKLSMFSVVFLSVFFISAVTTMDGDDIGPEISVYSGSELKWEEGNRDFFVMFKSLLDRKNDTYNIGSDGKLNKLNPQADSCKESATFELSDFHLPPDAYVTDAFLIWNAAQPAAKLAELTDNSVHLKFTDSSGNVIIDKEITAPVHNKLDGEKSFDFESFAGIRQYPNIDYTAPEDGEMGYYTYRVNITDVFEEAHAAGRDSGISDSRNALLGKWEVSGLDCATDDFPYLRGTTLVSNWSIFFVYTSSAPGVKPKKIYVYNGFKDYQDKSQDILVKGFKFPNDPSIRVTILSSEGDSANYVANSTDHKIPEGLKFRSDISLNWAPVFNICHPHREPYAFAGKGYDDIFNSISSVFGWNSTTPFCVGGRIDSPGEVDIATAEWAIDVDTFLLNSFDFPGYLNEGDTDIEIQLNMNNDVVYTNMMIVSLDTAPANFDIPEESEKNFCSCSSKQNSICSDSSFYYTVKVENWSEKSAGGVVVTDKLPQEIEYVAGTTEIASLFDETGAGINWTAIADGPGGSFPLESGYYVDDSLEPCSFESCPESYLIRFKVKPKAGLPKNAAIKNTAIISDSAGVTYRTNSDVPLRLVFDAACPETAECSAPDRCSPSCGGCGTDGTDDNGNGSDDDKGTSGTDDSENDSKEELNDSGNIPEDEETGCAIIVI